MRFRLLTLPVLATLLAQHVSAGESSNWWNKEWTQRQPVAVSAKDAGDAGAATVLVRLHDGNFQFPTAKEDGSDLRFIGDDGKELPYQIERYDGLMNEAFVWVKVPAVKGGEAKFTLYYGNPKAAAPRPPPPTTPTPCSSITSPSAAPRRSTPPRPRTTVTSPVPRPKARWSAAACASPVANRSASPTPRPSNGPPTRR
ncbi:DUF2341 domain-containing protein [Luteolibacter ambystomatis]|uniref:DUF2341 domain-containing protein n=1 Tax=Luteolibacter ambystomatis TaxID=2824561 RepID=A0A975J0G0_9BACT|nr:DUF2341 domain-containing protein [Luteolibacter ambystomatis]QUE51741.1 DUF2341 domain-containing protein [Luteolibacter ambystomatis]